MTVALDGTIVNEAMHLLQLKLLAISRICLYKTVDG